MKRSLLICAAAAGLTLAGCNSSENATASAQNAASDAGEAASNLGQTKPVNEVQDAASAAVGLGSAAAANSADAYVPAAAISDMFEIQSSKLASEKSQSAGVKDFARMLIADHTASTAKLKAALKSTNLQITPPTALDARRKGMIDNLKAASAADFDKVYLDQQTAAHREALTLHSGYAEDGENPALKQVASGLVPTIQKHLDTVQKLDQGAADGTR